MPCAPCMRARQQAVSSAKRLDFGGVVKAVSAGVSINIDKLKGVDVNAKYGVQQATPYRRTVK